jgi:D-tyrosyl-tRNA(Tyr) deacylase
MKAVVQRVVDASVTIDGIVKGSIDFGLLVYLGVAVDDCSEDADWLADKIINLRIFNDSDGKMNVSLIEFVNQQQMPVNDTLVNYRSQMVNGILAISQFTLLGDARKGRRPSWGKAAAPEKAKDLYMYFMEKIREKGLPCESGEFQAHMKVHYTNDGPVTILLDSKE